MRTELATDKEITSVCVTYCFPQHMEQELTSKSPLQHEGNLKDQEPGG